MRTMQVRKYCGAECQKEHLRVHKWVCGELSGEVLVVHVD